MDQQQEELGREATEHSEQATEAELIIPWRGEGKATPGKAALDPFSQVPYDIWGWGDVSNMIKGLAISLCCYLLIYLMNFAYAVKRWSNS